MPNDYRDYDSPLIRRYASARMSELWGPQRKFSAWLKGACRLDGNERCRRISSGSRLAVIGECKLYPRSNRVRGGVR